MKLADIHRIVKAQDSQQAIAVVKSIDGRKQTTVKRQQLNSDLELDRAIAEGFRKDKSQLIDTGDGKFFIHIFNPPLRLIIVGAVHIAKNLIPLAKMCSFDVVLIDPRRAFAESQFLSDTKVVTQWPDKAISDLDQGARQVIGEL